nr:tetratricopeptide repeat protein [Nitrospirillum iridis]
MALHQAGRLAEAVPLYQKVLAAVPGQPDACRLLGALFLQAGRADLALEPLRAVLASNPDHGEALNNLRVAYQALGREEEALAFLQGLAAKRPRALAPAWALATIFWQAGRTEEALPWFRRVVAVAPDHGDAWTGLARSLEAIGTFEEADAAYARAIALLPARADLLAARGVLRTRAGLNREAVADLSAAVALDGSVALYHYNLGLALQGMRRWSAAAAAYDRALGLDPALADARLNLANTLLEDGEAPAAAAQYGRLLDESPTHAEGVRGLLAAALKCPTLTPEIIRTLNAAVAADPGNVDLHSNLGGLFLAKGDGTRAYENLARALDLDINFGPALSLMGVLFDKQSNADAAGPFHERALEMHPDEAGFLNNMGTHLQVAGRGLEAIHYFKRALAASPAADVHSNFIFALDHDATIDVASAQDERRRWNERYGVPAGEPLGPWSNSRDPDRPLTVGYVSADFRTHSAAACFGPVVCGHDRTMFRVLCYFNSAGGDATTARFHQAADGWRMIEGLPDARVSRMIAEDGVDILVDLSGHTNGNRLSLFVAKPAPVQVSAWGHVTGTGIPAIDALFADPIVIPPPERVHFAERVVDLPCFLCFEPPPDCPPPPPGPASGAPLTFGCLNRLSKVSDASLDLWAMGLRARPQSRLFLKDPSLEGEALRADLLARLERRGVASHRVEMAGRTPRAEHLAAYGRIDVALDPVPYSGGVTTCEGLWMGVPVLALSTGLTSGARSSAAIMTSAGMADWVVDSPEAFAARMAALADDPVAVRSIRPGMRDRLARTPVFDTAAYTRAVEVAYRQLWRDWCARQEA